MEIKDKWIMEYINQQDGPIIYTYYSKILKAVQLNSINMLEPSVFNKQKNSLICLWLKLKGNKKYMTV